MKTFTRLLFFLQFFAFSGLVHAQGDTLSFFDFNGDLQGWTNTPLAGTDNWVFSTTGSSGAFEIGAIESTSATNGFALFDSDLLCSGNQNALLLSPVQDFSATSEVEIRFQSLYRKFQDQVFVVVTTDGGSTFSEVEVFSDLEANQPTGADLVTTFERVNLTDAAAGSANVQIGFRFSGGCDYAWMVDDIAFTNMFTPRPNVNLTINRNFAAFAPNFETPVTQTGDQNIYFLTDVLNDGAQTQDVRLAVGIQDANDVLIYTDTISYGEIVTDSLAENKAFMNAFPMPTEEGTFTGFYEVLSDSIANEATPEDNRIEFDFVVSQNRYSKGQTLRSGTAPNANEIYDVGNIYYTPTLGQNNITIDSVEFGYALQGFDDNTSSTFILISTYGYRGDLNEDELPTIGDEDDSSAELVLLGEREIEVEVGTQDGFYDFTLVPDEDGAVTLPSDQSYIGFAVGLSVETTSGGGSTEDVVFIGNDTRYNTSARDLAIDTLGVEEAYTTYFFVPNATGATSGFNFSQNALFLNAVVTVSDASNISELNASRFTIQPNPTSGRFTTILEIEGSSIGEGLYKITNAVGQEVLRKNVTLTNSMTLDIDASSFNNGLYFLEIIGADDSRAVKRFMVSH